MVQLTERGRPLAAAPTWLLLRMAGLPAVWSSLQSMNSMVSRSKGWDSTSQMMPYAPWYPGSNSWSYLTSLRAWPASEGCKPMHQNIIITLCRLLSIFKA